MNLSKIGFGGGCHWCTEGVFSVIKGVTNIDQGWIASKPPHDEFSEAVIVHYDEKSIQLINLVEIHLHTHACTSNHSMREKYRSAIYYFDGEDQVTIENAFNTFSSDFQKPIITKVLPFETFQPSPETYQNYYQKNPTKPFCKTYIDPKVQLLMRKFKEQVKSG